MAFFSGFRVFRGQTQRCPIGRKATGRLPGPHGSAGP